MKNLVILNNNTPVTTSLKVAEVFGKKHFRVLNAIRSLIRRVEKVNKIVDIPMFEETTYTHNRNGRVYPMYYLTYYGFALLTMSFTDKNTLKLKLKYIKAFNAMEKSLNKLLNSGINGSRRLQIGGD